jgi:DNA (cytosine-5)-methyltransferase 1
MTTYVNLEFIDEPIYKHNSQILRIGTDCSGIEAPIQALQQLGIQHQHVFSSDIDKYCIQSIKANYHPERIYGDPEGPYPDGDIRNRNHSELPDIDLYVCGFPCQPFSLAGKKLGLQDKRGNVFFSCIDVIRTKQPKYFILENVKGILGNNKLNKKDKYGHTWQVVWSEIEKLKELGYYVDWKLMNTRDYGIPQNRERVFIVGTKTKEYTFNLFKIKNKKLRYYIDNNDNYYHPIPNCVLNSKMLSTIPNNSIFIDFGFKKCKFLFSNLYSPTINANTRLWCVPKHRYANIKELLMLQGFDIHFKNVISKSQLKKQIGNSMSVNVVKTIINNF